MGRFATKLAVFATLQLALFALVERKLSQTPNPYSIKREQLEAGSAIKVLVLGSSHTLGGLNPDELGVPAVNLAGYSQDLYYDSQLALRYLDRLPELKCVVIGLSYFTLEYDMEQTAEAWRSCYYRRCFGIPHRHWRNELDVRNASLFLLYGPEISRQILFGDEPNLSAYVQRNGWAANPVSEAADAAMSDGPARVAAHHGLMRLENLAANLKILDQLLDTLRERGIQAVLLTTPVCASYSDGFDSDREARFHEGIAQLQARHDVRYFDFTRDQRFAAGDFYNSDHLNRDGAMKLSRLLRGPLQAMIEDNSSLQVSSHDTHPAVQ